MKDLKQRAALCLEVLSIQRAGESFGLDDVSARINDGQTLRDDEAKTLISYFSLTYAAEPAQSEMRWHPI